MAAFLARAVSRVAPRLLAAVVALTCAAACVEEHRPTRVAHVEEARTGTGVLLLRVRFTGEDPHIEDRSFGSIMRAAIARSLHAAGYEVRADPSEPHALVLAVDGRVVVIRSQHGTHVTAESIGLVVMGADRSDVTHVSVKDESSTSLEDLADLVAPRLVTRLTHSDEVNAYLDAHRAAPAPATGSGGVMIIVP